MSKREELKPCPFCGSTNVDPEGWASLETRGPACDDCGASSGNVGDTLAINIASWNRRATPSPEAAGSAEAPRAWGWLWKGDDTFYKDFLDRNPAHDPPAEPGWTVEPLFARAQDFRAGIKAAADLALEAFELGYCWRGTLVGQTLEDSRAVGRTLISELFTEWQPIDIDSVPSFERADAGIFHAKNAIRAAIKARIEALAPPAGTGGWNSHMATAPQDGSDVCCLAPEYKGPVMLRFHLDGTHGVWRDWDGDVYNPTAWFKLPLPAAPGDGG